MFKERAFARHEVSIDGKILSPNLANCVNCAIKDVSDGGALIAIGEDAELSDRVYLWQAQTGTTLECEVRWRKPGLVGLKFADSDAPAVRALTRICKPNSRHVVPSHFSRRSITMRSPAAAARMITTG